MVSLTRVRSISSREAITDQGHKQLVDQYLKVKVRGLHEDVQVGPRDSGWSFSIWNGRKIGLQFIVVIATLRFSSQHLPLNPLQLPSQTFEELFTFYFKCSHAASNCKVSKHQRHFDFSSEPSKHCELFHHSSISNSFRNVKRSVWDRHFNHSPNPARPPHRRLWIPKPWRSLNSSYTRYPVVLGKHFACKVWLNIA